MSGFKSPNHTQVPNDFFDMIPEMSDPELRVTLVMIRETRGWHRDAAKIGKQEIADRGGLSFNGVTAGCEAGEARGTFRRTNPNTKTKAEWELVNDDEPSSGEGVNPHPVREEPSAGEGQVAVKESINKESKEGVPPIVFEKANKTMDFLLGGLSPKAIQDAMAKYFKFTPSWDGNKTNRQWMQWAIEQDVTPEQIKQAADLWRSDKRFNWTVPTLKGIQEHWLELTGGQTKTTTETEYPTLNT